MVSSLLAATTKADPSTVSPDYKATFGTHIYTVCKQQKQVCELLNGSFSLCWNHQIEEAMIKHFLPCLNHTLVKQPKTKVDKPYVDKLIKIIRQARGSVSQRAFGKLLGVSPTAV